MQILHFMRVAFSLQPVIPDAISHGMRLLVTNPQIHRDFWNMSHLILILHQRVGLGTSTS